jgi:hypothetical protein
MISRRRVGTALAIAALAACGGGKGASDPATTGKCGAEARAQLDCSSEVKYDATNVSGGFSVLGVGGANGAVEQKALREIDKQTALFIAEARRLCDEYNKCVLDKDTYATRSENLRRRIAQVPELREEVKNASSDDARKVAVSKAYRSLVPDDARTELKVDLSVLAQKPNETQMSPIASGATLQTGSRLAFVLNVSRAAYVYVFQKSGSAVTVLFPDTRIKVANPVAPSTALRIPQGDKSFKLNDSDVGMERVYLVASLHPIDALAAAAENAKDSGASSAAIDKVTAIDDDCKTRGLSYSEDGAAPAAGCVKPRGLALDDDAPGGSGAKSSVRATTEAGDDVIATVFRFEHTR